MPLSPALQSALDAAETALANAQAAQATEAAGKAALATATQNDASNVAALNNATDALAKAKQAVVDAANKEFTLAAAGDPS